MSVAMGRAAVAASIALSMFSPVSARAALTQGYISILFGRTQYASVDGAGCHALPNTITLDEAAAAMDARGLTGVGNVIVNRTPTSGISCLNDTVSSHPGWDWLAARAAQGWRFVSASADYADITALGYADQVRESCGSLAAFSSHGLDGAQGMFAYPNNKWTVAIQADPVSACFDYGRQYGPGTNIQSQMRAPWFASVWSVNGGNCNDVALACYAAGASQRYMSPDSIAAAMNVGPGSWLNVQFYRFVTGSYAGAQSQWDCTSSDWRQHWSSLPELYCFDDFLHVMDAAQIAASAGATVTDPHSVAIAWGRAGGSPANVYFFSPMQGAVGDAVQVSGDGFDNATGVSFGGTPAGTFTVDSPTQITATVPGGAVTGPITVVGPGGSASSSSNFVVTEASLTHARDVSITLDGNRARGIVNVKDGFRACGSNVTVKVQHLKHGRWKWVTGVLTSASGAFRAHGLSARGKYRTVAKQTTLPSGDVCLKGISRIVKK